MNKKIKIVVCVLNFFLYSFALGGKDDPLLEGCRVPRVESIGNSSSVGELEDEAFLEFRAMLAKDYSVQDGSIDSLYDVISTRKSRFHCGQNYLFPLKRKDGEELVVSIEKALDGNILLSFGEWGALAEGSSKIITKMIEFESLRKIAKAEIKNPGNPSEMVKFRNEVEIIKKIGKNKEWLAEVYFVSNWSIYYKFYDGDLLDFAKQVHYFKEKFKSEREVELLKVEFARQMLKGLEELHTLGIVHSDVKLENFLISEVTVNKFQVVFTDFGLSFDAADLIGRNVIAPPTGGTIQYAAPELFVKRGTWEGNSIDEQIENAKKRDVYSMAVTLAILFKKYELVPWMFGKCDDYVRRYGLRGYIACRKKYFYLPRLPELFEYAESDHDLNQLLWNALRDDPSQRIDIKTFRQKFEKIIQF